MQTSDDLSRRALWLRKRKRRSFLYRVPLYVVVFMSLLSFAAPIQFMNVGSMPELGIHSRLGGLEFTLDYWIAPVQGGDTVSWNETPRWGVLDFALVDRTWKTNWGMTLRIPYWLLGLMAAALPAYLKWRTWKRSRMWHQGYCLGCGYFVLNCVGDVCPECGRPHYYVKRRLFSGRLTSTQKAPRKSEADSPAR
jgi:hypothetical protein